MRFISAALAAVLLIGGCGAIGNREGPENASASPPPSEGTVVISTGAAAPCVMASTFLIIAPLGQTYIENKLPFNGVNTITVDAWSSKSDFTDHQGNISVLNLPAGDYEVYTWLAGNFVPIRIPYAKFTVEAGKAVYVGEFYLPVACRANTLGGFRDQEDRDLSFVRQKNPAFASVVFDKRIARFAGYIVNNKQ